MTNSVIGALRVVLGLDSAAFEKGFDKSQNTMRRASGVFKSVGDDISRSLSSIAPNITGLSSGLSALGGPVALAATTAMAAFAFGLTQAHAAMQWGDDLDAMATKIGVSAEYLQKFNYAAARSDIDVNAANDALRGLNASLGAYKSGIGDAKLKPIFAALGITPADVAKMNDASDLLPILADRLSKIGTQAEQVQFAKKLGIEDLLPLLQGGSKALEDFGKEAESLGLVVDQTTVTALADLNDKVDVANERIGVTMKKSFVGLAPLIVGASEGMAGFTESLRLNIIKLAEYERWSKLFKHGLAHGMGFAGANEYAKIMAQSSPASADGVTTKMLARIGEPPPPPKDPGGGGDKTKVARVAAKTDPLIAEIEALRKAAMTDEEAAIEAYLKTIEKLENGLAKGYVKPLEYTKLMTKAYADLHTVLDKPLDPKGFKSADELLKSVTPAQEILSQLPDRIDVIGDAFKNLGDDIANAFGNAVVYGDNFGDAMKRIFQQMAAQWVTSGIKDIFAAMMGGKSGGSSGGGIGGLGSVIGSMFSSIFKIPGFADGTNFAPGGLALVGERGPELVNLNRGSSVFTASQTRGMLGGGVTQHFHINAQGAVMADSLIREMQAVGVRASVNGAIGGAQLSAANQARANNRRLG